MAYYFEPNSYANTLFGAPFARRRPSPPPATYYSREAYDPYLHALAEEQAARSALQDAARREREARQRRAEEEAKAQIRERMRKKKEGEERARQLRQSFYGYPYGYPNSGYGYEDPGYDDEEDYTYPYTPYFCGQRSKPVKKQEIYAAPQSARSPVNKRPQSRSPAERSTHADTSSKISIPISTPSKASVPQMSEEEKNVAASKIQFAFRVYSALKSVSGARERLNSILSSFTFPETLDFDMSQPPKSEDERPKLAYTSRNAPVHGHEDALVKLLQTLDAIESHGDVKVREARRELVREVEKELAKVDAEVRRKWEDAQSATTSPSPAIEPIERTVEAPTEDAMEVEKEAPEPTDLLNTDEVAGAAGARLAAPASTVPIPTVEQYVEPMEIEPSPSPEPYMLSASQSDLTAPHSEEVEEYFTPEDSGPIADAEDATSTTAQIPMIDSVDTLTETGASSTSQEKTGVNDEAPMNDVATTEQLHATALASPTESDVETPPHVSIPLPQPMVHTPEGEHSAPNEPSSPLEFEPMQVEKTPLSLDTRTPAVRRPVSIDDEKDRESEDDEVVIVDSDQSPSSAPASPVTEREFVVV